jgi:hypothetical protein
MENLKALDKLKKILFFSTVNTAKRWVDVFEVVFLFDKIYKRSVALRLSTKSWSRVGNKEVNLHGFLTLTFQMSRFRISARRQITLTTGHDCFCAHNFRFIIYNYPVIRHHLTPAVDKRR